MAVKMLKMWKHTIISMIVIDAPDGEDEIFDANVDKELNDHNERMDIFEEKNDAGLEHEDFHLKRDQELHLEYKFSEFNAQVDMEMPDFKVVMVFSYIKELKGQSKHTS